MSYISYREKTQLSNGPLNTENKPKLLWTANFEEVDGRNGKGLVSEYMHLNSVVFKKILKKYFE